jgi:hypothetical protein
MRTNARKKIAAMKPESDIALTLHEMLSLDLVTVQEFNVRLECRRDGKHYVVKRPY